MARYDTDPSNARQSMVRRVAILALIFAIILFLLGLNGRQPLGGVRQPAETLSTKALSVLNMPVRGTENLLSGFRDYRDLVERNGTLEAENTRLRLVEQDYKAVKAEVSYLKDIFGADIETGRFRTRITVRAVSEQNGPFVHSALINSGRNQGVQKGQAVLTKDGLYGRVIRTGRSSARVISVRDLSSRIPVINLRSRERAILAGDNSASPQLSFVGDGDWVDGDEVVTSGDDGVLPRGLPIGTVFGTEETGRRVRLFSRRSIDWMWVQPFYAIAPPVSELLTDELADNEDAPIAPRRDDRLTALIELISEQSLSQSDTLAEPVTEPQP
ncbi:rod shape-determining protein MreC [Robiginitomaculum antarcticum]|uniref:rod shape-determining protein MreC n=1 Tax=Robiginitomaculum antarcticum TaxID=437507 RepID=UPI0003771488|nr:rod shape-determining protein MreC [Robiginitomaculum antarcticum]